MRVKDMRECSNKAWGWVIRGAAMLLLWGGSLPADEVRRVLLINSFGSEFAPFSQFAAYLRAELTLQSPQPLDLYSVTLESARFDAGAQEGPFLDYLRALFAGQELDLVVPIGGPASRFAQNHREQLFPKTPMLLAGVDRRHLESTALNSNDAVVAVANDPAAMVRNILELLPGTTHVAVVLGVSPLEQFWRSEMQRDFQEFGNRVNFIWLHDLPFEEIRQRCASLPPRSAILLALLAVDAHGVPQPEERALLSLHATANAPIFGLYETQLGRGIVGGPLVSLSALASRTAHVAAEMLAGAAPATIRPDAQGPGTPQFDWRELQRWGIPEARLPTGSKIRFREPTAWQKYRWRIVGMVSLCVVEGILIGLLGRNLIRRRLAERALRESQDRLSLATEAGDVGVWAWHIATGEVWASDHWRRMFGFGSGEILDLEKVMQRIHLDDRGTVGDAVRQAVEQRKDYVGEFRVILPNGQERWLAAHGRVESENQGTARRMLGASVDVTLRKRAEATARGLSGRLIRAQEEERARLARELHDDITQRLARLAMDVGECELGNTGEPPTRGVREVREGLVRLSEDVHALTYRLHPSVLEDLGLAEALRAECERFSRQESVRTDVRIQQLPEPVCPETALCLFRVGQEALRNVERHAKASSVKVSLLVTDGGLQLAVQDDGQGFVPTEERNRPSLGLASMRERVHLLGGELDVDSAPGRGTTIVAWVPLKERAN